MSRPLRSGFRVALLVLCALLTSVACSKRPERLTGSGHGVMVKPETGAFDQLVVLGQLDVDVEIGEPASVEIRGDDNLVPLVTARVEAGALRVEHTKVFAAERPIQVVVRTPALTSIDVGGIAHVVVHGLKATDLRANVVGAGELVASGSAAEVQVRATMAGRVNFDELVARRVRVDAASGTQIDLGHVEVIDGEMHGATQVRYRGEPKLQVEKSGPGRLVQRAD